MERLCDFATEILSMMMLDVNNKAGSSAFSFTIEVTGSFLSPNRRSWTIENTEGLIYHSVKDLPIGFRRSNKIKGQDITKRIILCV